MWEVNMLEGKVAIVTGAAQGIGEVYARALASWGAQVAVVDIQGKKAEEVATKIRSEGGRAAAFTVDVADHTSVQTMVRNVSQTFGKPIQILVNNAAIYHSMRMDPLTKVDISYWRRVLAVNLDGVLLCSQAVAPQMMESKWGRIINQSSAAAYLGAGGVYGVSKLALIGLTQGLARELGPYGITVNAIAPGVIWTEATVVTIPEPVLEEMVRRQAIPKKGMPDDLLGLLRFLCSEDSSWITGQTFIIDGGLCTRL
jgi:3-oxoacyl-[acyl-carrier protein] reductase